MAFKMKGFSGFRDKMRIKKAKRLVRKNVGKTTFDGPDTFDVSERKYNRAEKKITKANKLLHKAGYGLGEREQATGAEGYGPAIDWAMEPSVRKRDKKK